VKTLTKSVITWPRNGIAEKHFRTVFSITTVPVFLPAELSRVFLSCPWVCWLLSEIHYYIRSLHPLGIID